ncbi:MAG: bifunctional 4-hydroxy-2-oxoglutarate aldolase/2-dehydro-3-deoxy-phosphogluconate aldolase [Myxococcales bacterium]|nr:bifunctional 4-hydroxy-2-oxoglutarate aldolase/2-dehydro-3-deoxy-phosphogluconate aldolase [Myxococcales bacterium]
MSIREILEKLPIVPLVQADDPQIAVEVSRALAAGGLTVSEVVFRTDRALECLRAVAKEVPEMTPGAGTVLSAEQAVQAINSGAKFVVSPGLDEGVVTTCQKADIPVFPGIYTPSDIQRAYNLGLDVVKFFPASIAGGVPALKALAGVFRSMRFMPTGGISATNLADFLALPSVLACGGSWLTPKSAIAEGKYQTITQLAQEAIVIAQRAKGVKQ